MASLMELVALFLWLVSFVVIVIGLVIFISCIITKELDLANFGFCIALVVVGALVFVGASKLDDYFYVETNEAFLARQDTQEYDVIKIVYIKGIPNSVVYVDKEGKEYTKKLTTSNIVHSTDENNYFCIKDNEYKNEHNIVLKEHIEEVYLNTIDFYKCKYHTDNVDIASIEERKAVAKN